MSAETDPGMDAYDLALLAAQLLRRRNTESDAVDAESGSTIGGAQ